jgi:hypothetical protein
VHIITYLQYSVPSLKLCFGSTSVKLSGLVDEPEVLNADEPYHWVKSAMHARGCTLGVLSESDNDQMRSVPCIKLHI